jgi:hypothetical protein
VTTIVLRTGTRARPCPGWSALRTRARERLRDARRPTGRPAIRTGRGGDPPRRDRREPDQEAGEQQHTGAEHEEIDRDARVRLGEPGRPDRHQR